MKTLKNLVLFLCTTTIFASCVNDDETPTSSIETKNKELVTNALLKVHDKLDKTMIDTFYEEGYIEHVPDAESGKKGLQNTINDLISKNTTITRDIARIVSEDDRVFVHSRVKLTSNTGNVTSIITGDIFRVENNKIVEHWGTQQIEVPKSETANGNSMIDGKGDPNAKIPITDFTRNKKNVIRIINEVLGNGNQSIMPQLFGETYTQHNPMVPNGVEALKGFLNSIGKLDVEIKQTIAQGDLVLTFAHYKNPENKGLGIIDIFRLDASGKAVEHWDVIQSIPETSRNDNDFF